MKEYVVPFLHLCQKLLSSGVNVTVGELVEIRAFL
jgi:hypothetical protein